MGPEAVRQALMATGEVILDDEGADIGYIVQPARFKLNRAYLARGGFLVVVRDEETRDYIGTEYDALPHPKTGEPYPAGHSEPAWRSSTLDEALARVLDAIAAGTVQ